MNEQLELRLLGGVHLMRNGVSVADQSPKKGLALLSYLVLSGRAHSRDELAGLLWGDLPDTEARANLRGVLFSLRRLVAPYLRVDRQMVAFEQQAPCWVDVACFQAGIRQIETAGPSDQIESLRAAVDLYSGDLMAGFYVRGAPAFEEWLLVQREQQRQLAVQGLYMIAVHYTAHGEYAAAIRYVSRLLEIEPWREEAHRQLLLLLALSGQRSAALAQYEACRRILADELRVEPAEETTALYQRIRAGALNIQLESGAQGGPGHVRNELRLGTLPFLSRAAEYAWLFRQWEAARAGNGVFTLVHGDAGVGKTRLIEELLRYAVGVGSLLLRGRCHRFEHEVAYQPIVEILRGLLQHMPALFHALPGHCLQELTLLLPELRTCRPDVPGTPPLSDEAARQRLFESVAQVCMALAGAQPSVVLFLDDLHQADPPTVDLLRYLLYRLRGTPLWCVGAYRSEEVGPDSSLQLLLHDLGQQQRAALLPLYPLAAQASAQLVARLPGLPGDQARHLAAYLRDVAEGNAFFLAQLLYELEQRGILSAGSDGWRLDLQRLASAYEIIPESVCAMIHGRLSRLPPNARAVLDMAAVIGRSFDRRMLIGTFEQSEQDVDACLEILLARHLVREADRPPAAPHYSPPAGGYLAPAACYEFTHNMLRRVIYASLSPGQQQRLQERMAQVRLDRIGSFAPDRNRAGSALQVR